MAFTGQGLFLAALRRCWSISRSKSTLPNPAIFMLPDAKHIICYHPDQPFPYEHSKPVPRTDPTMGEGDSVLRVQLTEELHKKSLRKQDLHQIFQTPDFHFRPRRKARRTHVPQPDHDRDSI